MLNNKQYLDNVNTTLSNSQIINTSIKNTNAMNECMNECMNALCMGNTEPGVFFTPSREDLEELIGLYESCIGKPLNMASAAILEEWFESMEPALIREAVRRTGIYARRPGAPYIRAILRNWSEKGIHTMKDLAEKEQMQTQFKQISANINQPWWIRQSGTQHPITEETYGKASYTDPTKPIE